MRRVGIERLKRNINDYLQINRETSFQQQDREETLQKMLASRFVAVIVIITAFLCAIVLVCSFILTVVFGCNIGEKLLNGQKIRILVEVFPLVLIVVCTYFMLRLGTVIWSIVVEYFRRIRATATEKTP